MAEKLNPRRVAIGLGSFVAVLDLLWALVHAAGYGQQFLNFKLGLMSLSGLSVGAFDPVNAALAVVLGFVGGAVFGWLFASVWNYSAKFK